MKNKSLVEVAITSGFYLVLLALAIGWVALLVEGFWNLALYVISSPFTMVATLLVLVMVYYFKKKTNQCLN